MPLVTIWSQGSDTEVTFSFFKLSRRVTWTSLASRRTDRLRLRCLKAFFFMGTSDRQLRNRALPRHKIFQAKNKRSKCRGVRKRPAGFCNHAAAR